MLKGLDHVTVFSTDLARTLRFYASALGLERGPRPDFRVDGHWLYLAGRPVVHVLAAASPREPAGAIDHVAFAARDRAEATARLHRAGVPFELRPLPDGSALQMFLRDPDGVRIELLFHEEEDR